MLYPEGLHGIFVTPEFHQELLGAYANQRAFLSRHIGEANPHEVWAATDTEGKPSFELQKELRMASAENAYRNVREFYFEAGVGEVDDLEVQDLAPGSVRMAPNDVHHLVEALGRQAASLMIDALDNSGTYAGDVMQRQARGKIALLFALHHACLNSFDGPKGISSVYASQGHMYED